MRRVTLPGPRCLTYLSASSGRPRCLLVNVSCGGGQRLVGREAHILLSDSGGLSLFSPEVERVKGHRGRAEGPLWVKENKDGETDNIEKVEKENEGKGIWKMREKDE